MDKGEGSSARLLKDPKLYDNLSNLTQELDAFANAGQTTVKGPSASSLRSSEPYDKLMGILSRTDETIKDIQNADGTMNKLIYDRQLYDKLVRWPTRAARQLTTCGN